MNIKHNKKIGLDGLIKAKVDILRTIYYKNILKFYCEVSNGNSNLLIYEYMSNRHFFDFFHENN